MKLRTVVLNLVLAFTLAAPLLTPTIAKAEGMASCDGTYHWVDVQGTESLDGTGTGIQYICLNGFVNGPLLIHIEGSAACFNGDTCDCQPDAYGNCLGQNSTIAYNHLDVIESFNGQRFGQENSPNVSVTLFGQTAAYAGPTSPFTGGNGTPFNFVMIPSTTGDAFMGNTVQNYTTSDGRAVVAHHVGYKNVTLDLLAIKRLFPNPSKVVVWGNSSGAVGADCNLLKFRLAWPVAGMWEMNSAGPSYGADNLMPLVSSVARTWGAWRPGPNNAIVELTCPILPGGSPHWNVEWVKSFNAVALSDVRKAFTDDYFDQTAQFFACLFGAAVDPDGTCTSAVTSTLKDEFADVISNAPNYKVYYHSGICHTEREADGNTVAGGSDPSCDYDNMQQGGVYFHDWVNAWINNGPEWVNIR